MSVRQWDARSAALGAVAWIGFGLSCMYAGQANAGSAAAFIDRSAERLEAFSAEAMNEAAKSSVVAVGPIEGLDVAQQTLTILGQRFGVASTTNLKALRVGAYAVAAGEWNDGQLVLTLLRLSRHPYTAGSSAVLLRGIVTSVDSARGQLRVGNALIDYTPTLSNGVQYQPSEGSMVESHGIQPILAGLVVAERIGWEEQNHGAQQMKRGISGGDIRGIHGGDLAMKRGISGGDVALKRGISGGDIRGIHGGDLAMKRGISGGDIALKRGISGGDIRGIHGGDLAMKRGISGGDIRGIHGGDLLMKRGISGGDVALKRGISGGDIRGIHGGDLLMKRGISGGDIRGIHGGDAAER